MNDAGHIWMKQAHQLEISSRRKLYGEVFPFTKAKVRPPGLLTVAEPSKVAESELGGNP
jgi:hypothetical protein